MILGERHNFGKCVEESFNSSEIIKPRTIYWEWLFLGNNSPLRNIVSSLSATKADPLSSFALLNFDSRDNRFLSGRIEKLVTTKPDKLTYKESFKIGLTLSSCLWFGLGDLHIENMMMGFSEHFVFTPIDIECVFDEMQLLSQTQIIAETNSNFKNLGAKSLLDRDINVSAVIDGFLEGIDFYSSNEETIDIEILKTPFILETPIRIVVRPTYEYILALETKSFEGFTKEELDQLNRGDVPYFFTYLNSNQLFCYSSSGEPILTNLKRSDFEILNSSYNVDQNRFNRNIDIPLIKRALTQIARTLDRRVDFHSSFNCIEVTYKNSDIYLKIKDIWRIKCGRLSYFQHTA